MVYRKQNRINAVKIIELIKEGITEDQSQPIFLGKKTRSDPGVSNSVEKRGTV
jgi:hypothetical protein